MRPSLTTRRLRTIGRAALLLALALTAAATPPPGTIQSYDAYRSWLVACDNALSCVARGFTDGIQGAEINVSRVAGPEARPVATIAADGRFALADIRIDGAPAGLAAAAWRASSEGDEWTSDDLATVRALVQALRNASKVTLGGEDRTVPLDGFAAAMLRLDERQGRLGGVTALLKPSPAPAARVPPPPPLPRIPVHPTRASLAKGEGERLIAAARASQKALFAKGECQATPTDMTPAAYALDGKRALLLIPCLMGAYQGSSLAFIAPRDGGPMLRLILSTPYLSNVPDQTDVDFFTEAGFDPKTGTLGMAAKGRGLADCGESAAWTWDGARFRLSDLALQIQCGGAGPGEWPSLFRSVR